MPRVLRRKRTKSEPLLSDAMIDHLRQGTMLRYVVQGKPGPTLSDVRKAWELACEDLIRESRERQPGSRPDGFWRFDYKGDPPDHAAISQAELLHAAGHITDAGELAEVEYLLDDPLGYVLDVEHDDDELAQAMHAEDERRPFGQLSDDGLDRRYTAYLPYRHHRLGKLKRWLIAAEWYSRGLPEPSPAHPHMGIKDLEWCAMDAISSNLPSGLVAMYSE